MAENGSGALLRTAVAGTFYLAALTPAFALPGVSGFTPSKPSPQPVGTNIIWTANASDQSAGRLVYRFAVKPPFATGYSIVRDFHPSNAFSWTPSQFEGPYTFQVTVLNQQTGQAIVSTTNFRVTSLVTQGQPVASASGHPLVALYSAPPCPAGSTMLVAFKPVGSPAPAELTNQKKCNGQTSMNFYLSPMEPATQYLIVHKVITNGVPSNGPNVSWTSGSIPSSIAPLIPSVSLVRPVSGLTSTKDNIVLFDFIASSDGAAYMPVATSLEGKPIWYYPALSPQISRFFMRPVAGGTMLIVVDDPAVTTPNTQFQASQILREFDLAGNTVGETNVARVTEELAARYPSWNLCNWTSPAGCTAGQTATLDFHHDAIRLNNGYTVVLVSMEKVYTDGTQGSSAQNPVDILGDMVVVLDDNWQVRWAWNPFLREDVTRAAVLGETCTPVAPGCPPLNFLPVANDWTHSNSLHYSPADGSLLISQRDQDFVLKIDFANGTGTGNILWRMGKGGDFTMTGTSDPYPWFSHQHHAGYDVAGQPVLSLFDNGNTRVAPPPTGLGSGNSRGMVLNVNESSMTVTPILMADLGTYSFAVGSAQRLSNANYSFCSGIIISHGSGATQSVEVVGVPAPGGTLDYTAAASPSTYRVYRLSSMYTGFAK